LARQVYPNEWKYFIAVFADATAEPFSYLLIDLKPETKEELRLKSKILDEHPRIYVPLSYTSEESHI